MIQSIGQVMLYVNDIEQSAVFWREKIGFERIEKQQQGEQVSYIIAPKLNSEVQFVLHDKAEVAQMNPGMNLETPSILFESHDVEATYQQLLAEGVTANPVIDMGFLKVFNFCDNEGNYFAVRERQNS